MLSMLKPSQNLISVLSFLFSFSVNLLLYKQINSRMLCDVLGALSGAGSYSTITTWLNDYTALKKPKLKTNNDVVFGVDNEQKLGKTYSSSIHSNLTTSCICVVVGIDLQLQMRCQSEENYRSSFWRFPERSIDDSSKIMICYKAKHGRETCKREKNKAVYNGGQGPYLRSLEREQ